MRNKVRVALATVATTLVVGLAVFSAGIASAATCIGNCGTGGPAVDGVVTASPDGGPYQWISTAGGSTGVGQIPGVGGTNGSSFSTSVFSASAGDSLEFFFNYITSDGSGFADYAWAELQNSDTTHVAWLFTARTVVAPGDTSPGFGLPANDSTLTPPTTAINPGGPVWSPLGAFSGACFASGCGYTGWIESVYQIAMAGNYILAFGVTNFLDTIYHSGLAWDGAQIGGVIIDPTNPVPLPAAFPLFATGMGIMGFLGWRRKRMAAA